MSTSIKRSSPIISFSVTDIVDLDMELKSDVASITAKEIIGEEHLIEVDTPIQISEFTSSKIEECPVASKIGK